MKHQVDFLHLARYPLRLQEYHSILGGAPKHPW